MRSLCTVSALFMFILACRGTGPAVRVEKGKTEQKQAVKATKKPLIAPKIAAPEQKPAKPQKTSAAEEKPATETAGEQKPAEPEKAPTPEILKELVAIIEAAKAKAATKEEMAAEDEVIMEITGLIFEETMTKIGYDFYEYFFLLWEAPQGIGVKDYNILISEKASPLWGSWVQVAVDETAVWSRVLRPRSEEIEDAAKEAIAATQQYLYNYEQYQFQSEDMLGTGI